MRPSAIAWNVLPLLRSSIIRRVMSSGRARGGTRVVSRARLAAKASRVRSLIDLRMRRDQDDVQGTVGVAVAAPV